MYRIEWLLCGIVVTVMNGKTEAIVHGSSSPSRFRWKLKGPRTAPARP